MNADSEIPLENIETYKLLYKIEIGLREFIIDVLSTYLGNKWHKTLPEDVKNKMIAGKESEKKTSWVNCIPYHPMYYVDFSDIVKIIEQGDKWKNVFSNYFSRKEIISSTLKELEPIRNKIAHNRKVTQGDLDIVQSDMSKLESWLTIEYLDAAIKKCTQANNLKDIFAEIKYKIDMLYVQITKCEVVENTDWWRSVKSEWWFDSEYLGVAVEPVEQFMEKIEQYCIYPHNRGCGHIIERWLSDNNMNKIYASADDAINQIVRAN